MISVFDHWVNEEEFQKVPYICYPTVKRLKNPEITKDYLMKENNFINFYLELRKKVSLVIVAGDLNKITFENLPEDKEFRKLVRDSIREIEFLNLYLPDNDVLIQGNFDLTHVLRFQDEAMLKEIKETALDNGLYFLD